MAEAQTSVDVDGRRFYHPAPDRAAADVVVEGAALTTVLEAIR